MAFHGSFLPVRGTRFMGKCRFKPILCLLRSFRLLLMVVEGPFLCHQQRVVDVLRKWFDQWHLSRRRNKARSSCIRIGPSAEQLEPRRMLSAGGLISRSAPLERTEAVYFSDGMGPDPVVFGKSEIIGQSQPSFVVTSVAHGVVQKWNDSKL